MSIEWLTKDTTTSAVTIYKNNITISKKAANYFDDAYAVAVGVDKENKLIILQKVLVNEIEKFSKESLYNISIKTSYGRINGKQLVDTVLENLGLSIVSNKDYLKYNAKWNTGSKMLIIDTKKGVEN
jgi:hypothetical protein